MFIIWTSYEQNMAIPMLKMLMFYDERSDKDENAYNDYVLKMIQMLGQKKQSGEVIEFSKYKNTLDHPRTVDEIIWKSISSWASFVESREYKKLTKDFEKFHSNVKIVMLQNALGE